MAFSPLPVIVLLGPTASGKTELAIRIAEALDLVVLSVDSRQLYLGMDIGTAKPTPQQRARVRHELLDLRPPDQPINLHAFRLAAEEKIAAERQRRGMAFLVGGSGLYLQALIRGLLPPAVPPQPALRAQLTGLGQATCRQLLAQADPIAAARIAAADTVRTQRALEVLYATGRPASSQQAQNPPPWQVLELGLDPPDLHGRIARRTRLLYGAGLVEETAQLIRCHGEALPLLNTIGYREAKRHLAGELGEAEAIHLTDQRTRQFAKRQRTWFRRQHQAHWLTAVDPLQEALESVQRVLR
jgi:tRNA dimethylallyltransferase